MNHGFESNEIFHPPGEIVSKFPSYLPLGFIRYSRVKKSGRDSGRRWSMTRRYIGGLFHPSPPLPLAVTAEFSKVRLHTTAVGGIFVNFPALRPLLQNSSIFHKSARADFPRACAHIRSSVEGEIKDRGRVDRNWKIEIFWNWIGNRCKYSFFLARRSKC